MRQGVIYVHRSYHLHNKLVHLESSKSILIKRCTHLPIVIVQKPHELRLLLIFLMISGSCSLQSSPERKELSNCMYHKDHGNILENSNVAANINPFPSEASELSCCHALCQHVVINQWSFYCCSFYACNCSQLISVHTCKKVVLVHITQAKNVLEQSNIPGLLIAIWW